MNREELIERAREIANNPKSYPTVELRILINQLLALAEESKESIEPTRCEPTDVTITVDTPPEFSTELRAMASLDGVMKYFLDDLQAIDSIVKYRIADWFYSKYGDP